MVKMNMKKERRLKGGSEHKTFLANAFILSLRNEVQYGFSNHIEV